MGGAFDLAVNFFVALFALIDPIGNVPLFAAGTSGATAAARRRIALYISVFVVAFLVFFFFTGNAILEFFGISQGAFRIAGGILLLLLGIDMAREDFIGMFADPNEALGEVTDTRAFARARFERLIVPFAMPLLIGPGAISTAVIYAAEARSFGWQGQAAGVAAILAAAVAVMATFSLAGPISRLLGRLGLVIVVRVLGLVLCALAVQFIIAGLGEATTGFISPEAAAPYKH